MNARNQKYIRPENPPAAMRLADSKLLAKKTLRQNSLSVPKTIKIISRQPDIEKLSAESLPNSFVLKPNRGFGGAGILIIFGRNKKTGNWVKADRQQVTLEEIKSHCRNIIDGNFSLSNIPDKAFFEERVKISPFIKPFCKRGVPDVRIVVYNKVPIMAMLRLPTEKSDGRANLHLGAIGVGIDMATGVTTSAIYKNKIIDSVPGTRLLLSGIQIPFWQEILYMAAKVQVITGLGYLGVDVAIDREKGPLIFELNARPGLSVQLANLAPLASRLQRIRGLKIKTAKKGVRIAQDLFGGDIEEEIEEKSGKKVIGVSEVVEIFDKNQNTHQVLAKIDTGAYRTTICESLAKKLQIDEAIAFKKVRAALGEEERPIIKFAFIMDNHRVHTEAFMAQRGDMKYDIIIGRRDLKKYIVDPDKNTFMSREALNKHKIKIKKEALK